MNKFIDLYEWAKDTKPAPANPVSDKKDNTADNLRPMADILADVKYIWFPDKIANEIPSPNPLSDEQLPSSVPAKPGRDKKNKNSDVTNFATIKDTKAISYFLHNEIRSLAKEIIELKKKGRGLKIFLKEKINDLKKEICLLEKEIKKI